MYVYTCIRHSTQAMKTIYNFYVGSKNLDLFKESTKKLQFLKKNMPNILER